MALPTAAQIDGRLDFDLNNTETGVNMTTIAESAIDDLFVEAQHYGSSYWTADTVPEIVKRQIIRATVRYCKNYDGFVQSRAGDETVEWGEDKSGMAGSAHFSQAEIAIIEDVARGGNLAFGSAGSFAWNPRSAAGGDIYVPTSSGGTFPLFAGQ